MPVILSCAGLINKIYMSPVIVMTDTKVGLDNEHLGTVSSITHNDQRILSISTRGEAVGVVG